VVSAEPPLALEKGAEEDHGSTGASGNTLVGKRKKERVMISCESVG